jgi:SAM-dependent methyltransferase
MIPLSAFLSSLDLTGSLAYAVLGAPRSAPQSAPGTTATPAMTTPPVTAPLATAPLAAAPLAAAPLAAAPLAAAPLAAAPLAKAPLVPSPAVTTPVTAAPAMTAPATPVAPGGTPQKCSRIRISPVTASAGLMFHAELQRGKQAFHENIAPDDLSGWLLDWMPAFRQLTLFTTDADYQLTVNRQLAATVSKAPPSKRRAPGRTNRTKTYLLPEDHPVPFLVDLGVMDATGRVRRERHDKFRQVNKYLEFIDHALERLPAAGPLRIVDFGCGKAYLTFAMHHYLTAGKNRTVDILGLDLKRDMIAAGTAMVDRLGCRGLRFVHGDIAAYKPAVRPDMIVSLHACDTATDEALAKGILWGCQAILAVPCCQHEFFNQLTHPAMDPVIRHGVTRGTQSTLVTDASRVLMLEAFGYRTEMVEFIDMEHTPKNVLIRAYRSRTAQESQGTLSVAQDIPGTLDSTARIPPAHGATPDTTVDSVADSTSLPSCDALAYRNYRSFLDSWGIGRTFLEDSLAAKRLLPAGAEPETR